MARPDERRRARVSEALRAAGGVHPAAVDEVAAKTGVAAAAVQGVGSFFHLLADPETRVRICQGPACRMRGSAALLDSARKGGLRAAGCSCLAACDRAPALLRDRTVLPEITNADLEATP